MNDESFIATDVQPLTLIARKTIRASAERIFAAWTEPAQLMQWWGPRADVVCPGAEVDLRAGGKYRIGNRFPNGDMIWIAGEYELIEPPHKLVFTWYVEADSPMVERVTVKLEPQNETTEVIVIHERIVSAAIRDQHEKGWCGCFSGLDEFLQNSRPGSGAND
jgi:uncharacterized protein YndB with AHSA1/START domain